MKNKIVKFGSFLGLALAGVAVSTSSYVASSKNTNNLLAIDSQGTIKEKTKILDSQNDDTYKVLWDSEDQHEVYWDGVYRFGKYTDEWTGYCLAMFPENIWENVIKNGTFYLDYKAEGEIGWENDYSIKLQDAWWSLTDEEAWFPGSNDIKDNNDGTFTLTINLSEHPAIAEIIDERDLLFNGQYYTPLRLYYGNRTKIGDEHYVNVKKREYTKYKNHAYITVDKELASSGDEVTATINFIEGKTFDYDLKIKDSSDKDVEYTPLGDNKYKFTMPNEDVNITADFKDTFTVTFTDDNHRGSPIEPQLVKYGESAVRPEDPIDALGYVFLDWYPDNFYNTDPWNFEENKIKSDTLIFGLWKEVDSVKINTLPAKTKYEVGEDLDLTDAKIDVKYIEPENQEYGEIKDVTKNITPNMIQGYDKYKVGEQNLFVVCGYTKFLQTVEVLDFTLALKSSPTKVNYQYAEDLDLTGAKITVTNSVGKTSDIDVTPEMVSGYNKYKAGEQDVTVTYGSKTISFKVTVAEQPTPVPPTPTPTSGGISTGALVGAIIGSVIGGAAIALGITFLILKKKQKPASK